jgi:putative acetyltransferase
MSEPDQTAIHCRHELPPDCPAIRKVITAAFGQTGEADLVDQLRAAGALSLSVVAEVGGEVVGYVGFSPILIESAKAQSPALALAPMAMLPAWQRRGIGSALLGWSLEACQRAGHAIVIVLGHADYYPRFGFVPAATRNIRCPFSVPDEAFMVLELNAGALNGVRGTVRYRPEFAGL